MFRQQILGLANDLLLTDQEALERVKLLAGAVFESLVEAALEEYVNYANYANYVNHVNLVNYANYANYAYAIQGKTRVMLYI